jgi:hypothetical protein
MIQSYLLCLVFSPVHISVAALADLPARSIGYSQLWFFVCCVRPGVFLSQCLASESDWSSASGLLYHTISINAISVYTNNNHTHIKRLSVCGDVTVNVCVCVTCAVGCCCASHTAAAARHMQQRITRTAAVCHVRCCCASRALLLRVTRAAAAARHTHCARGAQISRNFTLSSRQHKTHRKRSKTRDFAEIRGQFYRNFNTKFGRAWHETLA